MARGVSITKPSMVVNSGTNYIFGTNNDDYVNIKGEVKAGWRSQNTIELGHGNDTVWIGQSMWGYGQNTIKGGNGNKVLSIMGGVDSCAGAYSKNEIVFDGVSTDKRTLNLGYVRSADSGLNTITTGAGTDYLNIWAMHAFKYGTNSISLGDGDKYLNFQNDIFARDWYGVNTIDLGIGKHDIVIGSNYIAYYSTTNRLSTVSGDTNIWIKNAMWSDSENSIELGEGVHNIHIGNMWSHYSGYNSIVTEGTTTINIDRDLVSFSKNLIQTGDGNDVININWGINADKGTNMINTGAGNDTVRVGFMNAQYADNIIDLGDGDDRLSINGNLTSGPNANNYIYGGAGNDFIEIYGYIFPNSLVLDGGEGYDTLSLKADYSWDFAGRYQNWVSNFVSSPSFGWASLENIDVNINNKYSLNQISWLTNLINNHNDQNSDSHIDMSLNLDKWGSVFELNSIFTSADETAINKINLTGGTANQLNIHSSLDFNGYDNDKLFINGDANDTVAFDNLWTKATDKYTDAQTGLVYNEFHNSYNETVYVQENVQLSYV